ncbi:MAG: hypothetical protein AAF170_14160 [Bacteroidota bacterium]
MRLFALFALTILIGLAACDTTSSTIPVFGEPYRVARTPAPVLEADSLRLTVTYSGCNSEFEVLSSLAGSELWLKHTTSSGTCVQSRTSELYLPVDTSKLAPPPLRIYINRAETMALRIDSTDIVSPEAVTLRFASSRTPLHASAQ